MMTLLVKHSLTAVEQFQPESQPLNLAERQSTTTITVGDGAPDIAVGDWIRDDTEPGAGIVWRVKSVDKQYEKKTRTITLEHIINTLADVLMFGEVKPSDMAGTTGATTCTAVQAITYILNRQSDWTLGSCSYSVSNPYNFNGENLLDALETVSSSLEDCWWTYNMSVYPFTISFAQRADTVSTEMRMSRNISTARMVIDKSRMYTRIYPIGKNNLHIDGDYISKNENVYGRIDKTVTDQSKETKSELQRWANELLNRHCEPTVTVTAAVTDISEATGESLDSIVLGALCRMPLPKYNTVIQEIITKISYADKIAEPTRATVTMANIREDVASIVNQIIKSGGKGNRTHAKNSEADHAWIDDTNDHVKLVAEAVIGKDSQGNPVNWSRVAELGVDGSGINGRVTATEGDMIVAQAAITANENAITAEVTRATGEESSLSGAISVEAGKINQVVTAVGENGEVTAASICLAINQSGESEAVIDASKIYLLGQTIANTITANYISSKIASLSVLNVSAISATGNIHTSNGYIAAPYYYIGSGNSLRNMSSGIWALRIQQSGNTYTLQKQDWDDADWVDVGNFNKAVASWTMGWSSGTFTATANPQNQSISTQLVQGTAAYSGATVTVPVEAIDSDNPNYQYETGRSVYLDLSSKLQDKTGTAKFTANGTYTADTGYMGYGEITIDVPQSGGAQNVEVRFNGSSGSYYIEAFDSVTSNPITGANLTYQLGLNGTKVEIQNTSGTKIGADYQIPLQSSRTLTANGTYTPSSGNVGIASVTVAVPSDLPNAKARFNVSSGQYYIEAFDNVSTNPISGSNVNYKLGMSGNKVQIQNTSNSKITNTPEYDISTLLTNAGYAGRAEVTLNNPTWNDVSSIGTSRTVTVSTSGRTNSSGTASNLSKSVALYLTPGSWSSNKIYVYMRESSTSGTARAQVQVDASSLVTNAGYAGRNAVTLNDPSWNTYSGSVPTSRTVTVSTSGRTNGSGTASNLSKSVGLYLKEGSWSGNSIIMYMREGSESGTIRAQRTIDASARYTAGYNVGVTEGEGHGNYIVPVWGERYADNYNANAYSASGGTWVKKIYASASTGVHIPLSEDGANMNSENLTEIPSGGITANGNYKFRSGYAGIRYLSVNVPTGSSHSISQTHAYADNLATLASNLGASSSSALTNLGTFPAAGGRNYWGIRVNCGSSTKYYYVHTT